MPKLQEHSRGINRLYVYLKVRGWENLEVQRTVRWYGILGGEIKIHSRVDLFIFRDCQGDEKSRHKK